RLASRCAHMLQFEAPQDLSMKLFLDTSSMQILFSEMVENSGWHFMDTGYYRGD
ncbi:16134_t:CDS:1, partial [Acaulospora colombiana]